MGTQASELRAWLQQQVDTQPQGTRLPTDNELARAWGCSPRTARRVVKAMEASGKVERVRGSGTFVGTRPTDILESRPRGSSAELVADHLRTRIGTGGLKRGRALPQVKEVCQQFAVTSTTVGRAYRLLEQDELVTRIGKRYYVGSAASLETSPSRPLAVVYNVSGRRFEDMLIGSELHGPAYRHMERELMECGYRLSYQGREQLDNLVARRLGPEQTPAAAVISYVRSAEYDEYMPLLQRLVRPRREHLRILVVSGSHRRPLGGLYQLCTGNLTTIRARRFALFVREQGYRTVSFFQRYSESHMPVLLHNMKVHREFLHYCPHARFRSHLHFSPRLQNYESLVRHIIEELGEEYMTGLLSKYEPLTYARIARDCTMDNGPEQPFASHVDSDLWLFESQDDAVAALHWIEDNGMEVPRDMHVASLEDRDEHYGMGITCCGYDWQSTGYLMAHTLVGDMPVKRTRRGFIRTEGLILRRHTTEGPAPRRA